MIHPAATPREYCHTGKRAQHGRRQIKALPQEAGFIAPLRHNIWCDLRFEFVFITFRRHQASSGARPTRLPVPALAKFGRLSNGLGAKGARRRVTNHTKSFARGGFVGNFGERLPAGGCGRRGAHAPIHSRRWPAPARRPWRPRPAPPESACSRRGGRSCARRRNCSTARSRRCAARSRRGSASR
jgi:hypothetical protein